MANCSENQKYFRPFLGFQSSDQGQKWQSLKPEFRCFETF
jgi:hypothetical protein